MTKIRTYTELLKMEDFLERFEYLKLRGTVGRATFGSERYMNQQFYTSSSWRNLRHHVIARDMACDLADPDREINDKIIIHHMNPLTPEDLLFDPDTAFDPEFLICTTLRTHNAIHYGDKESLAAVLVERRPGDTRLW